MCCVECHAELATLAVKNSKEFDGVDLLPQLQNLIKNGCKSLLIEWLGTHPAFIIPTNQLVTSEQLTSQIQGVTI